MKRKFKVVRTWYVEAKDIQDAVDKSKNWDHDDVAIKRLNRDGSELPEAIKVKGYSYR